MRFGFLINEVFTGLRRNVTMTVAMILTTAISLGLFGGGLLVLRMAEQSRHIYLDRVESQVFLTDDISSNDQTCDGDLCKALRAKIEARNDVKSVRFLNQTDAYNFALVKLPQLAKTPRRTSSRHRSSSSSTIRTSMRISTRRCRASPACAASSIRRT